MGPIQEQEVCMDLQDIQTSAHFRDPIANAVAHKTSEAQHVEVEIVV